MRDTERTQPWPTPFLQAELVNFSLKFVFHDFHLSQQNQRSKYNQQDNYLLPLPPSLYADGGGEFFLLIIPV